MADSDLIKGKNLPKRSLTPAAIRLLERMTITKKINPKNSSISRLDVISLLNSAYNIRLKAACQVAYDNLSVVKYITRMRRI